MTKIDLMKALRDRTGGAEFITRKEIAAELGYKDPHNIDHYLYGLDRIAGKRYFIPDVAAAVMATMTNRQTLI